MKILIFILVLLVILIIIRPTYKIPDNIVPPLIIDNKPPMGWNTWNCFGQNINEKLIIENVDSIINKGLDKYGYKYIILDDGWASPTRDSSGNLEAHSERFPSGMKFIGDYIHSKGLKFGLYTSIGKTTCEGYPGSYGNEYRDMKKFEEWGVDYVKIDWCTYNRLWWPWWNYQYHYHIISKAIQSLDRPMFINICNWGFQKPWDWGPKIAHSWRITYDIKPTKQSIDYIIRRGTHLQKYNEPGRYNDLDSLQIGNGLSKELSEYNFELWCKLKSPLILGCDMRKISDEDLKIITNKELILLNQS